MNDINYFLPGQLWQYNTRNGEEASTLTVLKISVMEIAFVHRSMRTVTIKVQIGNIEFHQHS